MENETKDDIRKEPHFFWSDELVAEVSHEIALTYAKSQLWTGDDLGAEKGMISDFVKRKKFEQIYKDVIISEAGETLIVRKEKLEEVIRFLFNYRD